MWRGNDREGFAMRLLGPSAVLAYVRNERYRNISLWARLLDGARACCGFRALGGDHPIIVELGGGLRNLTDSLFLLRRLYVQVGVGTCSLARSDLVYLAWHLPF